MFNNATSGYSLADIAAATGSNRNDNGWGFGGDGGAWWIIILFLFCFAGWGGNGNGLFGGGSTGSGITDGYILTSDFANIERKIDGVDNGVCDGFYAMNTGMLNGFASINNNITQQTIADMQNTNAINAGITNLGTQLQQCCCQTRYEDAQNFAQLNYNLADQECSTRRAVNDATRDLMENQNANTRSILGALQDMQTQALHDKIAELTSANSDLKFQASQAAQNSYLINALNPSPVPAYTVPNPYSSYKNCGCSTL